MLRARQTFFFVLSMVAVLGLAGAVAPPASAQVVTAPVIRVGGADRHATAALLSSVFDPGVPVAFVATGDNFPDALAAGPAAARAAGPILLTSRFFVPQATIDELDRLDPGTIIVLGGAGVIDEGVLGILRPYTTSGTVVRVAGNDRFETAARVAGNFPSPVDLVYVASGRGFADALAAGPAAGVYGGPLLLVEPDGIPAATAAELDRLDPTFIVIAGDTQVVSANVANQLTAYAPNVLREAGADRYATSVAVSSGTYEPGGGTVFLATGLNFPDAIAASAFGAPILLSQPTCVPAVVYNELVRLAPDQIIVLGGESTLGPSVAALQICSGPGQLPRTG